MDELKKEIERYLKKHTYGVLATADGDNVRATPVMYSVDRDLNVLIYSENFTAKFEVLAKNSAVSFAIHNSRRPYKGLQLWGSAEVITAEDPRHEAHLPLRARMNPKLKAACAALNLIRITTSRIVMLQQARRGGPYVVLTRTADGRETLREVKSARELNA